MHLDEFLTGAFVYLAAAVIAAPIAKRLGLGSVLGYLIAGMVLGPAVANLIGGSEGQSVMHFAEFGVVMMLFLVGLELQPSKLWELRRPILGLGGMQVSGVAAAVFLVCYALGFDWRTALVTGLVLAMSSTALVLQSLGERGLLKTSSGQSVFSVLLFQDIAIIPMLALLPLLATGQALATDPEHHATLMESLPAWGQALAVFGVVGLIILTGRYLMPPLFRLVASAESREIFVAFALVLVVGITLLMQQVGLSAALGTFLAGVVLAESEYRHELEMDLDPFKGLLLAVFFIAVGAGIDFGLIAADPVRITAYVFGFVALKLVVQFAVARIFRMNKPNALRFAFSLAQGGEFAFVLIAFVAGLGLLTDENASTLIAVVAISLALAPVLMIIDDRLIQPAFIRGDNDLEPDVIDDSGAKVIIAGYGRFGMTIGRFLQANGVKTVVLDHDAEQVDSLRKFGFKLFYGDASRLDLLEAAGAHEAQAMVIALKDKEKVEQIVETVRRNFPHLKLFMRATDRVHAYELLETGIENVYREMFDSSVHLAEDLMVSLGRHPYEIHRAANLFRKHDDDLMRLSAKHHKDESRLIDMARKGRAEISNVLASDRAGLQLHAAETGWDASGREDA